MKRPVVLVTARQEIRKDKPIDYVSEVHLELLLSLGIMPIVVPVAKSTPACLPQYMEMMDGLLMVEGDDVDPHRFAARKANYQYLEHTHPLKDKIEIRVLRRAIRRGIPILGICRGSQLMNAVCGGSLYGDVQKEKGSDRRHIDLDHYDTYRHPLSVVPDTPLAGWYRRKALNVNSYHHQGIRRLASRFRPMAHADDGLIEAYYDPAKAYMVGLQFHPERMLKDYAGNANVWKAFAAAVRNKR